MKSRKKGDRRNPQKRAGFGGFFVGSVFGEHADFGVVGHDFVGSVWEITSVGVGVGKRTNKIV